jgi:geranylgeranyl diphosphate synthase type I
MTFQEYASSSRILISDNLKQFFEEKKKEDLPTIFKEQGLVESLEEFALRGKLVRGTLFLLATEMLGLKLEKELIDISCAIEIMHSSLLTQDDIIDNDYTRRGAPTIFAKYSEDGEKIKAFDPYHYGISTAIVVADVAFFFAIELLSNYDKPQLSKLLKYYAHEIYLVSLAESADSIFGQTKIEPSKEDIYSVYLYKTARYTFSLPFEMAAIVSKVPDVTRKTLSEMGQFLGIIFQLKDDELGLFGDENTIGKPVGSDIRENKKTLIRALLYEKATDTELKILDSCFGNAKVGPSDIDLLKELYEKHEIKSYIDREIKEIMAKVWKLFENLDVADSYKEILKGLLEFNLQRTA